MGENKARKMAYLKSELIEQQNKNPVRKPVIVRVKNHSKNCEGICKICGNSFSMITVSHANRHGYETPEEMIEADVISWL